MSRCTKRQLPLLQLLAASKPKTRKKILKAANFELVTAIVECVYNVIVGNVAVSSKRCAKLKTYKKILRRIQSTKENDWLKKKKIIVQSGGSFLPLLLQPVISYLLGKIINS